MKLLGDSELSARRISDELGPELVLEFNYVPSCPGLLVIDNSLLGFSKGGLRIVNSISVEEICNLARICTYRNALLDIPFGGGRSAIICDHERLDRERREKIIRSFAKMLRSTLRKKYIVEPDLNTGSEDMKVIAEELGCWSASAGKPREYRTKGGRKSGIPHDPEVVAIGLFHTAITAASQLDIPLRGMKILIVGLGEAGMRLSSRLAEVGAHILGVIDLSSKPEDKDKFKDEHFINGSEFLKTGVDVIMVGRKLSQRMAERFSEEADAKLVIEGEDLALGHRLRARLSERDIMVLPDSVANCGGTVASFCELRGIRSTVLPLMIEKRAVKSTIEVLGRAELQGVTPAEAVLQLAENKLRNMKKDA